MKDNSNSDLLTKVKAFRKKKLWLIVLLLLLGMSGAIIPIIPGTLFIILAIALMRRGWMEKIRQYFR